MESGGPDALILTSTILTDPQSRAVPKMALEQLRIPVLSRTISRMGASIVRLRICPRCWRSCRRAGRRGNSVGDPCEAMAFHVDSMAGARGSGSERLDDGQIGSLIRENAVCRTPALPVRSGCAEMDTKPGELDLVHTSVRSAEQCPGQVPYGRSLIPSFRGPVVLLSFGR